MGLARGLESHGIELVVLVPSGLSKRRDIRDMCNGGTVKNTGSFTDRNADEPWADVVTRSEGLVESRKVGSRQVAARKVAARKVAAKKECQALGIPYAKLESSSDVGSNFQE